MFFCVAAVVKDIVFSLGVLEVCCMFVFYVCIMTRGAVGACVWEVWVFRHADIVCLCLVCIL